MSQWVYGAYNATLNIHPCEGDMVEYCAEVEEALKKYDLREFEGIPFSAFFWALSGSPLTAILTSGVGRNLMSIADRVSQSGGVWHLEFDGVPFEVDLEPALEWGHRFVQTPKTRKVKASAKPQSLFVPSPFSSLSEKDYAELVPKE
jgi:hypothetical protein